MPTLTADTQFLEILQDLPSDLAQMARDTHAFVRARKVRSPEQLAHLVLAYSGLDWTARDIAAQFTLLWEPITDEAIAQRLAACGPWIRAMLAQMICGVDLSRLTPGARVLVCDGSTVQGPGAKGIEHRVHLALDLVQMQMCDVRVTDAHTAERLDLYRFQPGDLLLADGGFARVPELCRVAARGAHPVVRINAYTVIASTRDGERIRWVTTLSDQAPETIRCVPVIVTTADGTHSLSGWVHAFRQSEQRAERERRLVRRRNKKRTPRADTLVMAGWVLVFTTIPPEQVSAEAILQLYRCRWQVELAFKRYKSLLDLDELRARRNSPLATMWVLGKLLYAALLERRALRQWGSAGLRLDGPRTRSWWRIMKLSAEALRPVITGASFWRPSAVADAIRMLTERTRRRHLQQLPHDVVAFLHAPPHQGSSPPLPTSGVLQA